MSARPTAFESVTPIFVVHDLPQALEFYQAVLGFDLGWSWGEPPHIASVCRDRVEVNLAQRSAATTQGPSHAYFRIDAIGDYYAQLQRLGAKITVALADRPYGMSDFTIEDASGNRLSFGQATGG